MNNLNRKFFKLLVLLAVLYLAWMRWEVRQSRVDPWYKFADSKTVEEEVKKNIAITKTAHELKNHLVDSGLECHYAVSKPRTMICTVRGASFSLLVERKWRMEFQISDGKIESFTVKELLTGP